MICDREEIITWEREWHNERCRNIEEKIRLRRWHIVSAVVIALEIGIPVFLVLKFWS